MNDKIKSSPFVISSSRIIYDGGPAMFPGLSAAKNGDFILSFCTVPDGLPGGKVCIIRSSDKSRNWTPSDIIAQSSETNGSAHSCEGLVTLKDGTIILPYTDIQIRGSWYDRTARLYILLSVDDGFTWSKPVRIAANFYEPTAYGKVLELADGTLLLPIEGRYKKDEKWRAGVFKSNDGGNTWSDYRTIAYDPNANLTGPYSLPKINVFDSDGKLNPAAPFHPNYRAHSPIDGFNETSLRSLPDGRIIAVIRQQGIGGSDRLEFYRAISSDGGETWTSAERMDVCGMSPCLHWSPAGRLILAYRRRVHDEDIKRGYGVALSWSEDYGETWTGELLLKDPKCFSYTAEYQAGYPTMLNLGSSEMIAVFYSYDPQLPFKRYLAANFMDETAS